MRAKVVIGLAVLSVLVVGLAAGLAVADLVEGAGVPRWLAVAGGWVASSVSAAPAVAASVVAGLLAIGATWWVAISGGVAAVVVVGLLVYAMVRLLQAALMPVPLGVLLDTSLAQERAIIEVGDPGTIAVQTVPLLWDRTRWVIRRVERISLTDRTMVRRHVSIDFRMPQPVELTIIPDESTSDEILELIAAGDREPEGDGDGSASPAFIPITILRGWPPVLNLDLRDAAGRPVSLLSKAATNALDSALLSALAKAAYGRWAEQLETELVALVHENQVKAEAFYMAFMHGAKRIRREHPSDVNEEAAGRAEEVARVLVHSTLLWVPASNEVGVRTIIKLAYDEPLVRHLGSAIRSFLATFALRGIVANFEVGQVGDAGSYHLEIDVPAPLELLSADMVIADAEIIQPETWRERLRARATRVRVRARRRWRVLSTGMIWRVALVLGRTPVEVVDPTNNSQVFTRRAHLYASGQPPHTALATLRMVPERRGTPLAGAMTGILVALTLAGLTELAGPIYDQRAQAGLIGAVLAFLLLAPTLVSYVLSRGEHPAAARALAGVRLFTVTTVLLSIGAAGVLVWSIAEQDARVLTRGALVLRDVAFVVGGVLLAGVVLPLGRRWRRRD
jgi:hypothetical protein